MKTTAAGTWARIIPFLQPIEMLIRDPEISDIMINGSDAVFFEKHGRLERLPDITLSEKALQIAARNIARSLGDDINEESPLLDSRLPDGSRVAIVLFPVSVTGTSVTIRKFQNKRYNASELVRVGTLTDPVLQELRKAVRLRKNILISEGTGTGKTTLLNALAAFIEDDERLIIIEDTSEVEIDKPNVLRFEARRPQPQWPGITIGDLLRATLRTRPDRILLGEVRGAEAFELLQAMNTGHQGTLSTIHANSARQTLARFATCVMMAGIELHHQTVRAMIGDALDLLVHIERWQGKRFVNEILQVNSYDQSADRFELRAVYTKP